MQDTIIKGTGNSYTLKSVADFLARYPTYESMATALIAGTFPVDIGALVAAGVQQQGTALNKANLLSDPTAAALGLASNPTVNDAFAKLAQKQTISAYNSDFYLYATGQHPVLNPLPYSNYFYCKYLLMMHYFKDTLARSIGQEFALTGNAETISTVTTIYDGGNL